MYGYNGTILRINLSNNQIVKEDLDLEVAQKYIGARGLGVKTFIDKVDVKVDTLSEENKLIIATGVITAVPMPISGRYIRDDKHK